MFETILRALLTFLAHAIAATHLAPLKYSKSITYSLWAVFVLGHSVLAFFLPSVQWATPSLLFTVYMLACVLHVLLFFITTTGRLGQRAFLILSYTVFFTACCGITDYFRCFLLPPDSMWYLLIYGAALGLALYVLLGRLRPAFPEAAMFKAKEWRLLSALMVMFFVLLTTWFVYPNRMSHFTRAQAAGFPAAVLLLFATYGTIFICVRTVSGAERAEQMRMQLDLLTLQVQTQQKTVEDARRSRHDLRHNNLLLLALAEKGETQELLRYLRCETEQEPVDTEAAWCENDTLSSILSIYENKAAAAGIQTDIMAQAERELPVLPTDIVAITANLFENAIHGAAASKRKDANILVRIHQKSDKLVIRFENSCDHRMKFPDGFPAEQFGVGLLSVQKAVDAYEGECVLTAEHGVFTALALLNLPS